MYVSDLVSNSLSTIGTALSRLDVHVATWRIPKIERGENWAASRQPPMLVMPPVSEGKHALRDGVGHHDMVCWDL